MSMKSQMLYTADVIVCEIVETEKSSVQNCESNIEILYSKASYIFYYFWDIVILIIRRIIFEYEI